MLFYAVLANLPFWAASHWFGILRHGWFCLDYVAVGLLALYLPRIASSVLIILAVASDVLAGVCETYFFSVSQCFTNLDALREFPPSRLLAMAAIALLTLLAAAMMPFLLVPPPKKRRGTVAGCLIAFSLICLIADSVTVFRRTGELPHIGQIKQPPKDLAHPAYLTDLRLARVPTYRLVREAIVPAPKGFPMQNAAALGRGFVQAARKDGIAPNFVLVLVESWGQASESSIRQALVQPYAGKELLARYRILQGIVPFHGPTAAGEARELCGSTMGFHVMVAPAEEIKDCLPRQFIAQGYRAVALHGMNGNFYTRSTWYRTIGFQDIWFEDRFAQQGMPTCLGSFSGICDASIAEWMGRRLQADKANPDFLYWVTLNSHLPVLVPSPLKKGASCAFSPSLAEQPSLCSWYQLEMEVHRSVANLAVSDLGRPTVFVIVGDHAPPFSDLRLRSRFAPDVVPYVLLVPRSDDTNPGISPRAIAPTASPDR